MALNAGDLVFLGFDADNNDAVMITTATINAGEEIFFTDDEWNGSTFNSNEQLIRWVVPNDLPPGTVLTLDMIRQPAGNNPRGTAEIYQGTAPGSSGDELAGLDYLRGGGALSGGSEQIWIIQGDYDASTGLVTPGPTTNAITGEVTTGDTGGFVTLISNEAVGDSGGPNLTNSALTPDNGAVIIDGNEDFMIFDPIAALGDSEDPFVDPPAVLREQLLGLVGDSTNWVTADGGGNQNPGGGFDFNLGNLGTLPRAIKADETTQIFFTGDRVAFFETIDSVNGDASARIEPIFAFEPTDLVIVSVLSEDIYGPDDEDPDGTNLEGEFNYNEVQVVKITVRQADGTEFDLDVNGAVKVKESGGPDGSAKEAGDSFFTLSDNVPIPGASVTGEAKMAFSLVESFRDEDGNLVDATIIERTRTDLDSNDDDTLDTTADFANANFNVGAILIEPFPCFVSGTLIDTPGGPRAIETLTEGDLVLTRDHGPQTLRWIGHAKVPAHGENTPILIRAGALGNETDLCVSPQHRVLVQDWRVEAYFGLSECLVAAKHLCNGTTIVEDRTGPLVDYVHLLFDDHELVCSAGLWSESYFPGSYRLDSGAGAVERELRRLFPERFADTRPMPPARPFLRAFEARLLR